MKICSKCKQDKELEDFGKESRTKDGLKYSCKSCNREGHLRRVKKYNKNNPEIIKERKRIFHKNNKDKINKTRRIYREKNKDLINKRQREYFNKKFKDDFLFKLKQNIRNSIKMSFKSKKFYKNSKTIKILGCSFSEFKSYLESKFEHWMNWDNHGVYTGEVNSGWDIDHIIPVSSAKTEGELIKLNHYTNLQPLCSKVNRDIKKG